ncbi:peroxide stress protein YaaA [Shewanella aegiceratis]|uniref:peroxide stress protein YaaA n=1 Tax=Shewanella aegiceratis TaxID=2864203 RepID=UPI001C65FDC6|nr:peroxide stress protein YaaA [Shewanella aegiceratis]QYJ83473.1 peroxide stress protein YaaA [Shewanella aegiceratis]
MLILVSPAKTLDYETPASTQTFTMPALLEHSEALIKVCRELTPADIASLMKVSDKIAGLNAARFAEWHRDFNLDNAKQALFAFRGDVYTGLDADTLSQESLAHAQQHLRILSGLYGLLRPLDLMQAYRLEMGTKLANDRGANLYQFWGDIVTQEVNKALAEQGDDILVNLASNEYFKSVKPKQILGQVITPIFKDKKNGQYKVISFFAKKARGMMVRYMLDNKVSRYEELLKFDTAGYYYSEADSSVNEPVFLREEQA